MNNEEIRRDINFNEENDNYTIFDDLPFQITDLEEEHERREDQKLLDEILDVAAETNEDYPEPPDWMQPLSRIASNRESTATKRALAISFFTKLVLKENDIKAAGEKLFVYSADGGCYTEISNVDCFFEDKLPTSISEKLLSKDLNEIYLKILRNPMIQVNIDEFNDNDHLINCENGVIDISGETIAILPHSPKYLFNYCIKAKFLTGIRNFFTPALDDFVKTSLDNSAEKKRLLLEMLGYIFSDSNAAKAALFFRGSPNSGKTIFIKQVERYYGEHLVCHVQLHDLNSRFNKAQLFGKKVNAVGEIKAKPLSDITTFKMITGDDSILGEFKGKDSFFFRPKCKLLYAGNALPGTTEADATKAFSNRLVVLMFNRSIPPEEQDKELLNKLFEERDEIFTLAILALKDLRENNYEFSMPQESLDFVAGFSQSENTAMAFVHECCILEEGGKVLNVDLLAAYSAFCKKNGLDEYSKGKFYEIIDALPGVQRRKIRNGTENRHGRSGIKLKPL